VRPASQAALNLRADSEHPIGLFDSGVGGLTILRAVAAALPRENLLYVADTAHLPYGQKSPDEIRRRARAITRFLVARQVKAIVVACNTATAMAIDALRGEFDLPFVGVEPAVKPAFSATRSGVVGVLATPATLESERFAALVGRFGGGVRVATQACAGLAEHIERGNLDSAQTETLLRGFVEPLLAAGADTIVLGCTHYPLVLESVRRIAGPRVAVIENGSAVARELSRQLDERGLRRPQGAGWRRFHASGSATDLRQILQGLGEKNPSVEPLTEDGGEG
jgi:glutamate racemase